MQKAKYEQHNHPDSAFPVIFHHSVKSGNSNFELIPSWHESPEFLYILSGNPQIFINGVFHDTKPGDLVVINSGDLHIVRACEEDIRYHCLIADVSFLELLKAEHVHFPTFIRDEEVEKWISHIAYEHRTKAPYYKEAVCAGITELLICLLRKHTVSANEASENLVRQMDMTKSVIHIIQKYYDTPLTLDILAQKTGFSKFYIGHIFREVTGIPPMQYLIRYRCNQARKRIASGMDVNEAAISCGFESLSYFSRTYRKYIGNLPSKDKR